MLACTVNKGICGKSMVRCCMAAGCINLCKSYASVFRFPKISKLNNRRTIAETFVLSWRLLLSTTRPTE